MLLESLSNDAYHRNPAVGSTSLKKLLDVTPARLRFLLDNPEEKRSEALVFGSLLHSLILEPDTVFDRYVIETEKLQDKTKAVRNGGSKEIWEDLKKTADATGKDLVKNELWLATQSAANAIKSHDFFHVIAGSRKEVSLFSMIEGVSCKARYDAWNQDMGIVIDLKTMRRSLSNRAIQREIIDRAYHLSAAMYLRVGRELKLNTTKFVWMFIENFPPYSCRFVEASKALIETGERDFLHCLEIYRDCMERNYWPDYAKQVSVIEPPEWYVNRDNRTLSDED